MKKQVHLPSIIISCMPMLFLTCVYNLLADRPNTNMEKANGLFVSKTSFIFIIALLCFTGYYLSSLIALRLSFTGWRYIKPVVSTVFALLVVLLILSNMA